MRHYNYIILISFLCILNSCGIHSYRTFEISQTDNYGKKTLYTDSLVQLKVGVLAYDYNRNISVFIESLLKDKSDLIIDSISINIIFPHTELVKANYELTNIFINNKNTLENFKSFKSIPSKIKMFDKNNKSIKYELEYWDFSRPNIPKSIKNISLEIYVNYQIERIKYEKIFNVNLLSKTHRYFWIIRDD